MAKFRYVFTALILLFLIGCAKHNFIPDRLPMPEGLIPQFSANNTIKLINESDPKKVDVNVLVAPFQNKSNIFINYRTWTDEIIQLLKDELVLRGMKIDNKSDRTLKIKLKHVYFSVPFMGFHTRTYLTLDVTVGEFYTRSFTNVLGKSGIDANKSSANAMLHTVEAIMNNAEIQKYIRGAPDSTSSAEKRICPKEKTDRDTLPGTLFGHSFPKSE